MHPPINAYSEYLITGDVLRGFPLFLIFWNSVIAGLSGRHITVISFLANFVKRTCNIDSFMYET